jgi:hypothetical protein
MALDLMTWMAREDVDEGEIMMVIVVGSGGRDGTSCWG